MARGRGRGRGDYDALQHRAIPVTPHRKVPPTAPRAPGTQALILRADGTYEPAYRPPTEAEKAERAKRELIEGQKTIDAFLAKARSLENLL